MTEDREENKRGVFKSNGSNDLNERTEFVNH